MMHNILEVKIELKEPFQMIYWKIELMDIKELASLVYKFFDNKIGSSSRIT